MRRFFTHVVPVFAYAALIFYLSSQPGGTGPQIPHLDKVMHFSAYFVFALLLHRAFVAYGLPEGASFGWAFVASFAYGVSDEIHQSFTPLREPSLLDLAADVFGAFCALFTASRLRARRLAGQRQTTTS